MKKYVSFKLRIDSSESGIFNRQKAGKKNEPETFGRKFFYKG